MADASVDDAIRAAHRVPAGSTVAGAAAASNLRALLWGGRSTALAWGPAWERGQVSKAWGTPIPTQSALPTRPGVREKPLGAGTTFHRVGTEARQLLGVPEP